MRPRHDRASPGSDLHTTCLLTHLLRYLVVRGHLHKKGEKGGGTVYNDGKWVNEVGFSIQSRIHEENEFG